MACDGYFSDGLVGLEVTAIWPLSSGNDPVCSLDELGRVKWRVSCNFSAALEDTQLLMDTISAMQRDARGRASVGNAKPGTVLTAT